MAWKITGPLNDTLVEKGVIDTNRRMLFELERQIPNISGYFKNLSEWAKI
jgi:hypothetical protein